MTRLLKIRAEAFDIMQYFYRTTHDPLVRCLVRLDGAIDEETLKKAVALSAGAVPQILCRFNDTVRRPRWEESGCAVADAVRVRPVEGEGAEEALLAGMTVDIFTGPQLAVTVARRSGADTLCIVMNHMVCDGGGFKEYLYLLCDLYGKCLGNPEHDVKPALSAQGLKQLAACFTLSEKLRIYRGHDDMGKLKNSLRVPLEGGENSPFIARLDVPPEPFATARLRAKALGATANDMLLAAYARALSRVTGERAVTLPCPVDLRKYLPAGAPRICNLTSNLVCNIVIDEGEPYEATVRNVAQEMAARKQSDACVKGPLLYGMLFLFVPFRVLQKNFSKLFTIPVTSFTNLGVLDDGLLRFSGLTVREAYLTGAIKRAPYFQVTASTYRGRCTLTCNLHGAAGDRERIRRFLDGMGKELVGEEL